MAKKKAIEICKNLHLTIQKIKNHSPSLIYKLEDWKPPTASASDLTKVLKRIEKKYNLRMRDYLPSSPE